MAEDGSDPIEPLNSAEDEEAVSKTSDNYRSIADPNLMIFVEKDVVPPFRFKAGGWDLLQSSIDLGPAMKTRIADNGFFLFRVNEDKNGGVELSDPQTPLVELGLKAKK
jgi:hypothetical protein